MGMQGKTVLIADTKKGKDRLAKARKKLSDCKELYLFILPVAVYFFIFSYMPLYGIQLSFKYFNPALGIAGSKWVGFDNFTRFFKSFYFWRLMRNTVWLSLYSLIAAFPFPIIMALTFNEIRNGKLKKAVQTIAYAPHFISVVVLVGILNLFFNTGTGFVNVVLKSFNKEAIPFLTDAGIFPSMYVWSGVWQNAGWNSIIYIAALSGIDPQLHEAAQIDGANKFQRIIHINIPSIMPTIVILFILNTGRIMNVGFEKIFLMQNSLNIETSDVIPTFVYQSGLINMDYGFSTAVGLFNNVINVIMLLMVNRLSRKVNDISLF
jgi:putative aldouronate transport system permease protein